MCSIELSSAKSADGKKHPIDAADLAVTMVANFRAHPHICNVMTHISGGNWTKIKETMAAILDVSSADATLSKLAENIVELICADGGTTGRILKPFFDQMLAAYLPAAAGREVRTHVTALFRRTSLSAGAPAPAEPALVFRPQRTFRQRQRPAGPVALSA
ncbi:hypothetical protein H9Q09_21340 [Aurantimonas sp. DM33-3]|uniref:hypothetical protein n=1 Tax=Aurantimonas sp. DM33-3 TaxID=2766955 RepID=UPI0016521156|nr:hypothetical protein [Aurantimonas sp. DM33-3]MBC6718730.1 hypothetical protein [Aurantimonas sp. DM33-3]